MITNFAKANGPKYGEHMELSDLEDGVSESSDDFSSLK